MADLGPRTHEVLPQLSIEEKAAITAGSGFFNMTGVERLGIPNWLTTDGPNGARGSSFLGSGDSKATCIPCGSALGATWNPALVEELGKLLGDETRTKACRVLLAPTVNLHRPPLAGRNFECFSEDPLLSGKLAAAYIRGVQSQGVITTVKHFVGNESETDRWTSDSVIDDREEVVITRAGHDPVVIVSLEDYEALKETAYLMRSPANARRLLDAMERLESGRGEHHDLVAAD